MARLFSLSLSFVAFGGSVVHGIAKESSLTIPQMRNGAKNINDNDSNIKRRLNYEWLAGYRPRSLITDHAAIDLDQQVIVNELEEKHFDQAKLVYERGGHSKSLARLSLPNAAPPKSPIPADTLVVGLSDNGDQVQGTLVEDLDFTDTQDHTILVEYDVSEIQRDYMHCQVGGLVASHGADRSGCFQESGQIQIIPTTGDPFTYDYTYNVRQENFNMRTIQSMTAHAEAEMNNCDECPHSEFQKFVEYYGPFDYADQWINAAFDGESTNFLNGNANFDGYRRGSRAEAIKTGTAFMAVWMYTIHMMEMAIDECKAECGKKCHHGPVPAWDQAVAYYVGSLEGESGADPGNLLYDLADRMCVHFRSCGELASLDEGTSYVNHEVMREFRRGQSYMATGQCDEVQVSKDRIVKLMAVPLIQATLRMAHLRNFYPSATEGFAEVDEVAGASFAATVLPLVHNCHPKSAEMIYQNMQMNPEVEGKLDFTVVKAAFEHSYECMGTSCKAVGGIWHDGEYAKFATPCKNEFDDPEEDEIAGKVVGITLGVFGAALVAFIFLYRRRDEREEISHEDEQRAFDDELTPRGID